MTGAVLLPVIQRGSMDCGMCCLEMVLERPYDVIREKALALYPTLPKDGLTLFQLQRTASKLGVKLLKRVPGQDEQTGILQIKLKGRAGYHYVVLFNGSIVNPADGMLWTWDAYMENKGKPLALLALEDTE